MNLAARWARFRDRLLPDAAPMSAAERWRSTLGALIGVLLVEAVLAVLPLDAQTRRLLAPLGASSVIVFALPHSPLGQPWSLAGGLIVSALAGYLCGRWIPSAPLALAGAVAMSVWWMARLRCLHPPGGAMAIVMVAMAQQASTNASAAGLLAVPVNVLALLFAAMLVNNLLAGRRYPFGRAHSPVPSASPRYRLPAGGIAQADVALAVKSIDSYLDVSGEDLVEIFRRATEHAFRRQVDTRCGDIMTRDVICAEYATPLEEAWRLLRTHHIKVLPVLDRGRHVIGLLSMDDFLRHVPDSREPVAERLRRFMRPTRGDTSHKPEVVGQIMREDVFCVHADDDLAHVAASLAQRDHVAAIPVLGPGERLVGILSQTDLVSSLYQRLALSAPAGLVSPKQG